MSSRQLSLGESRSNDCPFVEFLDIDDIHCYSFYTPQDGYEVIGEDHPRFAQSLADVRNIAFSDIVAKEIPKLDLPLYIPVVRRGSQKILRGSSYPFIAVTLGDIVNGKTLSVVDNVRSRYGIPETTKLILLCYGKDKLIEQIWPKRDQVFTKIAALGFDLITAVNYSVWFDQPHAERLINLKRGLLTFEEFQKLGVPTIPHIYWSGKKDLERWSTWISQNHNVTHIAINLQTERGRGIVWDQTLVDLRFFVSILDRPIHFFITGPSTPNRIAQLQEILPTFSLTNGHCARQAASGYLISQEEGMIKHNHSMLPKNKIMEIDAAFYINAMNNQFNGVTL